MSISTPTQILVRTGNVTSSCAGIARKGLANSQRELVSGLRENFKAAIADATSRTKNEVAEDGNLVDVNTWTTVIDEEGEKVLSVPGESAYSGKLREGREGYEVTGTYPPHLTPSAAET